MSGSDVETATPKVRFSHGTVSAADAANFPEWEKPVPVNRFWDSLVYCNARNFVTNFSAEELAQLPIDPDSSQSPREKSELLLLLLREKITKEEAATEPSNSLHEADYDKWSSLWMAVFCFEEELQLPQAEQTLRTMIAKRKDPSNLSLVHSLAAHLLKIGKYKEAEEEERPVCVWMDEHPKLGKDSPQAINARRIIAKALWFQGESRRTEAEKQVAEIHAIVDGMGEGKFGFYRDAEQELNQAMMAELERFV